MLGIFSSEASPRRKQSLRGWILIAWLSVWTRRTAAQEVVTAAAGGTAALTAPSVTADVKFISWFRGTTVDDGYLIIRYFVSPPVQVTGPLSTGRESLSPDGTLHIRDLRTSDNGSYTVDLARNIGGLTIIYRQLRVYVIPAIRAVPQNPVENGSLVLVCNASGIDVSYQWYQDDKLITPGGRINLTSNSQTLTLSPCTRNDTGINFTCRASNAVSQSNSSQYTLTISYGPDTPVITASPEKPIYLAGSNLTLSCTAASHPPALYTWLLNGQSLSRSGPELHFNSLNLTDSGNYTCNTINNVTNLSNQATWGIRVQEKGPNGASNNGPSGGAIAGIVIAAVVALAGMGVLE